ncbi:Nuclear pore complex subunit [Stylosanthes scabra]|uniref:Nuclear pore complex subunit n=1 Tax=Stylosanthes scabra TaxID=79078 RepID=A0ABU6QHC3_9FABA|nr:Nuclear pore complex subunit [Stylosanthes scabra]
MLTASATATLLSLNRGATHQWTNLFPRFRPTTTSPSKIFANSPSNPFRLRCSSSASNAGTVSHPVSESEESPANFVWSDSKKPRICILGGGFGGLYTALRLESLEWPDDKTPQPLLYELLSGEVDEWEIAPRFSDLLVNTSIVFFKDRVKCLHPSDNWRMNESPKASSSAGTVHLESGLLIEYDWLVLSLGAETKLDVVPGAAEFAFPFSTLEDARKVNNKLTTLERKTFGKDFEISVAVVGCGYSGVELAATIAERLQNKGIVRAINVDTIICPNAPPGNREAALKVLSSRRVELLLGYFVRCIRRGSELESKDSPTGLDGSRTEANDFERYILELQPAERGIENKFIEADLVLWTVGSKPPLDQLEPSDAPYVLPLNARGQAETDETLRVKGHPRIFALGDSSALRDSKGRILPATAQVAFQQADFTGWNLWAAINGRPLLPFRFQNLGEMMTLGRNDAAISPSFVEGLTLEGPVGHTARKIAYLMRLPTDQHRLKVGISWLTKSAIDSVSLLQSTLTKVLSSS